MQLFSVCLYTVHAPTENTVNEDFKGHLRQDLWHGTLF